MKTFSVLMMMLLLYCSCINNPLDSKQEDHVKGNNPLHGLLTKSGVIPVQEDSLTIMSNIQKDVNNLMMSRILLKDSTYVLAIKKQDAVFLGVTEDVYDKYVEYVAGLNKTASEQ